MLLLRLEPVAFVRLDLAHIDEAESNCCKRPIASVIVNQNPYEMTPRDKAGLELRKAFSRLSPQGSSEWNFSGVFSQLDERYGHQADSELTGESPNGNNQDGGTNLESTSDGLYPNKVETTSSENEHRDLLQRAIGRWLVPRLLSWVDDRSNRAANRSIDALIDGPISTINARLLDHHLGLSNTTDAFRFLSARVQELESQTNTKSQLSDHLPSLTPPVVAGSLTPVIVKYIRDSRETLVGQTIEPNDLSVHTSELSKNTQVLHGECANAELIVALNNNAIASHGVEPRAKLALGAIEQGLPVTFGEVPWYMKTLPESYLGGLVLNGFIEQIDISEICNLLKLAVTKLAPGAPLVLLGLGPNNAVDLNDLSIRNDLSPAKPLHLETWQVLLREFGFSNITSAFTDEHVSKDERTLDLVSQSGSDYLSKEGFQQASFLVMGRCRK